MLVSTLFALINLKNAFLVLASSASLDDASVDGQLIVTLISNGLGAITRRVHDVGESNKSIRPFF